MNLYQLAEWAGILAQDSHFVLHLLFQHGQFTGFDFSCTFLTVYFFHHWTVTALFERVHLGVTFCTCNIRKERFFSPWIISLPGHLRHRCKCHAANPCLNFTNAMKMRMLCIQRRQLITCFPSVLITRLVHFHQISTQCHCHASSLLHVMMISHHSFHLSDIRVFLPYQAIPRLQAQRFLRPASQRLTGSPPEASRYLALPAFDGGQDSDPWKDRSDLSRHDI